VDLNACVVFFGAFDSHFVLFVFDVLDLVQDSGLGWHFDVEGCFYLEVLDA